MSYPSVEMQSVYSTPLADLANLHKMLIFFLSLVGDYKNVLTGMVHM